ncbi:PAS-domain containing protein [Kiloniella sp. EL199]|uniref:sensor histidine kinase n=1 Tax=Kiloniella sp. EL199 TaxID=2107581 RepID=UPI000EA320A9|nr:PAS-domain containing protein [Kiloniella sp. EL199]
MGNKKGAQAVSSAEHASPLYLPNQAVAFFDKDRRLIGCDDGFRKLLGVNKSLVEPNACLNDILLKCIGSDIRVPEKGAEVEILDEWLHFMEIGQPVVFQKSSLKLIQLRLNFLNNGGVSLLVSDASSSMVGDVIAIAGQLKTVVENITQGISLFDRNCNLVLCNQRFLELMDFPQELGQPGTSMANLFRYNAERGEYGPGNIDHQVNERMELAYRFEPHHLERTRTDGTVVEVCGNPLQDGFVTTYNDITVQKKIAEALEESNLSLERRVKLRTAELQAELQTRINTEEQLRNAMSKEQLASRSKNEFLANMSHELRTPLNCIIGFSELLKNESFGPLGQERYKDYCADINNAGVHLLEVLNDILDVSKLETGDMGLLETEVDLSAIIESSVTMLSNRADSQNISLVTEIPNDLPYLYADARRVKQVLINLLSNAVKFSIDEGEVIITASVGKKGNISLTVADKGIGISDEDLAKVVDPFHQVSEALTRNHEGTGLGLHIVNSLVELHGGQVVIESELGVGTSVCVSFPRERSLDRLSVTSSVQEHKANQDLEVNSDNRPLH